MSKKTVPDLKELFKQAAEIAAQVPENMQEAAFNRAIDLLTNADSSNTNQNTREPKSRNKSSKTSQDKSKDQTGDQLENLVEMIDSTQHPGVLSAAKVLDRALMVLHIALNDHGIDGLTPSEISTVLTDKFRVSTSSAAVRMALGDATDLVNRVSKGKGYSYRIMGPGEEYLAHLESSEDNVPRNTVKKRRAKKKQKTTTKTLSTNKKSSKKKATGKKGTSALGPKAAIVSLIESGYFDKARTGPEIQAYLNTKRGLTFDTDPLRMTLLRLVRDLKLDRDENGEGNYEYHAPKS